MPKEQVNITLSSSAGYLKSVDYMLDHINDKNNTHNPNKYAFILVAASALESILNNGIIWWAHNRFPMDDYKRMASAFHSMSLRAKLDAFIYVISNSEYITNNESNIYQQLSELIKVRNEVAHKKDFFRVIELDIDEDKEGTLGFEVPDELKSFLSDTPLSLAVEQCKNYRHALNHLHDLITGHENDIHFKDSELCKKITQQSAQPVAAKDAAPVS